MQVVTDFLLSKWIDKITVFNRMYFGTEDKIIIIAQGKNDAFNYTTLALFGYSELVPRKGRGCLVNICKCLI